MADGDGRAARLAEQLRVNLARRKGQRRARAAEAHDPPAGEVPKRADEVPKQTDERAGD